MIRKSIKRICDDYENIENYDKAIADTENIWICHHRMECIETGAVVNSSRQDLIDRGIYWHRPADELIFLIDSEHRALHSRNLTDETKEKLSKVSKGKSKSEEWKRKIADAHKGLLKSEETCRKISESKKGQKPWNIGLPSLAKGTHWYNNGVKSVMAFECPDGFKPGRLVKNIGENRNER